MLSPLDPSRLRRACNPDTFDFETTEELESDLHIIGQPRGTRAIDFGIHISSPGYNIFVLGDSGTGRTTAIKQFIETKASGDPVPDDWVYVNNFAEPHKPIALSLPPGLGAGLRETMNTLVEHLIVEVPRAFDTPSFRETALAIQQEQNARREKLFSAIQKQAGEMGAAIINTPDRLQIVPLQDGQPVPPQALEKFSEEQLAQWRDVSNKLQQELNETVHQIRLLEKEGQDKFKDLVSRVAASVVDVAVGDIEADYEGFDEVLDHIHAVHKDILKNIHLFRDDQEGGRSSKVPVELQLRRYKVNVIVDHRYTQYAPVVLENNPSVHRLLGRIEHESRSGGFTLTDFTLVRGGALHEANGGFLVIRAKDLFTEPGAWEALKRVLIGGEIAPDDPATRGGAPIKSLDPHPIPADLKVILIGPKALYYQLFGLDEDFRTIFKVMADFDLNMDRTPENELEYAGFIANLCEEEGLLPFNRGAVARMVEYGSRIADSQEKLSTRFGFLADMLREANFWAIRHGRAIVTAEDVLFGVERRIFRSDRIATQIRENIQSGKQMIATEGEVVGQINALYVSSIGEHSFGQPTRVTAKTFVGKKGIVQIDREVDLTGPIHDKGVVTLNGYLGAQFARERPLSFNAQISFEQSYIPIEGDSASSTELYALISSLAEVPIRQSIAVTGSVNQLGEIQAIGGVNHKIEGWFELCRERGLNGQQGVLIPAANVNDLMLRPHILKHVEEGKFNVWAIQTVDEGLEILTGLDAATIHEKAGKRLEILTTHGQKFD